MNCAGSDDGLPQAKSGNTGQSLYIDVHACDLRVQCLGADFVPVFDCAVSWSLDFKQLDTCAWLLYFKQLDKCAWKP